jgi:hypothetical protein
MAVDFPNSPATNDTFTVGNITWQYDGTKWKILTSSGGFLQGSGSPEGSVTAGIGMLYGDTSGGRLWVKAKGTGNTGWVQPGGLQGPTLPTNVFLLPNHTSISTRIFTANGDTTFTPVFFTVPCTLDALAVECTTAGAAGSLARLGVFSMNSSLQPGTLLDDAGTVATDSTGAKSITGRSISIPGGWVFIACAQQGGVGTQATMRVMSQGLVIPPPNSGSATASSVSAARSTYTATITGAFSSTPTVTLGAENVVRTQYRVSSVP